MLHENGGLAYSSVIFLTHSLSVAHDCHVDGPKLDCCNSSGVLLESNESSVLSCLMFSSYVPAGNDTRFVSSPSP